MPARPPHAAPPFGPGCSVPPESAPLSNGVPWIAVDEVMSPPGATLSAGATVWTAIEVLLREDVDRVWLTAPDGRLAGEVTNAALLRAEIRGVPGERPVAAVSDPVAPLDASSDAAAAVVRLGRGVEARVPVTRGGALVGELTRNDVLSLVHGVRRVAGVAGVPTPAAETAEHAAGPAAPRFLSRRAGVRGDQPRR